MQSVIDYVEANQGRFLEELKEFLRIPSISTDSRHRDDIQRAAQFLVKQFEQIGLTRAEIFSTDGHPLVYAERIEDPSLPTILIYGHYDVQPVDPIELWESPPFEPAVRDGELYARGAADDKGQLFIHLKSVEAFLRTGTPLPVNVKYLIEGEEEIGSPNLDPFVRAHKDLIDADAVVISDTAMFARDIPSICYGLRGLAYLEIELVGPERDLHSGSFGGAVANPAFELARLLASMKDEKHRITIPRFYDDVRELTQREREEFASLPFDIEAYKKDLGVAELAGEEGFTPLEQLWARPTLEINGFLSGFTGEGAKTVLPSKAMAKVSMRLVPDQDPDKVADLFEEYVQSKAPATTRPYIKRLHGGRPWVADLEHPAMKAAANAVEKGFGKRPVFQREGGSIPVVATFAEILKVPSVLMGIGLPDENAHAPNEKLDLQNFRRGIISSAYFFTEFSRLAAA
ncbi:MAG TPA: dipeptidase [Acidobacteriota bacterium]|nr:dipeptidase [Acidobacteriota bacterium]